MCNVSRPTPRRSTSATIAAIVLSFTAAALPGQTPECPGYDAEDGIVWGTVRATEGGTPVPGAEIVIRWASGDARAQSLSDGLYIACGVPTGIPLVVRAFVDPFSGAGIPVRLEAGETREITLGVTFGWAATAAAVTGRVVGMVVDRQTLQPVANAVIGAGPQGYTAVTDGSGRFRLDRIEPGEQAIRVRHIAYGETEKPFEMPQVGTLEVLLRLDPAVLPLEPLEVEIVGVRSHKLEMVGFYDRREWSEKLGLGHFITRKAIDERGAARVSHILREVPRVQMMHGSCFTSRCDFPVILGTNPSCRRPKQEGVELVVGPSLYLDGRRVRHVAGQGIDAFAHPGDIAAIEVYTGTGDLPGEFADFNAQKCGAIVLWTGR